MENNYIEEDPKPKPTRLLLASGMLRLKRAFWASVHKSAYCAHFRISTEQMRAIYVNCALLCASAYFIVHFGLLLGAHFAQTFRPYLRT